MTECVWSELTKHAGPTPKNTISYPSFKKRSPVPASTRPPSASSFELDGNLDGFITEKEFRENFDKCSDKLCEAMCESSLQCPERRTSIKTARGRHDAPDHARLLADASPLESPE